jgi:hypothetical protein
MMIERRLKIFMTGGIAVLCAFVVAGNIHDPGTNFLFVQHSDAQESIVRLWSCPLSEVSAAKEQRMPAPSMDLGETLAPFS